MLLEPSAEDADRLLPPLYQVEVLAPDSTNDLLQTLDCLPSPLGALESQPVRLARVLENQRLTTETHF